MAEAKSNDYNEVVRNVSLKNLRLKAAAPQCAEGCTVAWRNVHYSRRTTRFLISDFDNPQQQKTIILIEHALYL